MGVVPLALRQVEHPRDLLTFIRFPWKIYEGNTCWVPPLIKDQLQKLSPNSPFRSHAEMILYLAYRGEEVVGRIAGIIDHHYIEFHQEKAGFFGFFESIHDLEVSDFLLSSVEAWLRGKGMEKMMGPMNPSTNDECGLLIDAFDLPPLSDDALQSGLLPCSDRKPGVHKGDGPLCLSS